MTNKRVTAKEKDVLELVKVMDGPKIAKGIAEAMFGLVDPTGKAIEALLKVTTWEEMANEFFVSSYMSAFTRSDIQGLIKFYKTKLGQKLLDNSDNIQKISSLHGEIFAQKCVERMEERNLQEFVDNIDGVDKE